MYTLSGISAGYGIGIGSALTVSKIHESSNNEDYLNDDTELEIEKFNKKVSRFSQKLLQIVNPASDTVRDLLGATAGYLTASENKSKVIELITKGYSAHRASTKIYLNNLVQYFTDNYDNDNDKEEIKALINEFIRTLDNRKDSDYAIPVLTKDVILIDKTISPAQLLSLETKHLKGLILEEGRDSGHLSIVLRELGIPAVFGVFDATSIKSGSTIIVDSNAATVIVDPHDDIVKSLGSFDDPNFAKINDDSLLNITISAAVGAILPNDDYSILTQHGLGLLRSEFLFLSSQTEPTEYEMTKAFYAIFSKTKDHAPLAARTFDFADDKKPLFNVTTDESGPLKDYGALVGTNLLKKELRAMLKASSGKQINIIFPLITRISEKDYLHHLAKECLNELSEEGLSHGTMKVSFMVETPAAVLLAPAFAKDTYMMLLGSSSLAEYASAPCPADRAFTPVLAKMIAMAAKAASEAHVTLGIAGKFASRTELLPFYFNLGVSYLVTGTYNIIKVKEAVENLNLKQDIRPKFNQELYDKIMQIYTGDELTTIISRLSLNSD